MQLERPPNMFERAYQKTSSLFPRFIVQETNRLMIQGGFDTLSPRQFLGFALIFSLVMALVVFFTSFLLTTDSLISLLAGPVTFLLFLFLFYLMLILTADERANKIEAMLPDALQIISSNIKAGMTLENAIWTSARPEFGPLRDEIKRVSSDTFGGTPVSITLGRMTNRVHSPVLERAIRLIVEGIRLGGEMSKLLDEVAEDIRGTQILHKEVATSTLTYMIFIVFTAMIAAPLLFSISTFYSEVNANVLQKHPGGALYMPSSAQTQGLGALSAFGSTNQPAGSITPQDIFWFSLASIFFTNLFAALIVGEIQSGKASQGIKFIPVFVVVSIGAYLVALSLLHASLGALFH